MLSDLVTSNTASHFLPLLKTATLSEQTPQSYLYVFYQLKSQAIHFLQLACSNQSIVPFLLDKGFLIFFFLLFFNSFFRYCLTNGANCARNPF